MTSPAPGPSSHDERAELHAELLALHESMETMVVPRMMQELLTVTLTMQQLKVLAILVTKTEGNTVQGLATTLGVSLATMSGILDRLTNHGMATRTEDPHDHRVRRVIATAQGRDTVQRLLAAQPQIDREPLERMAIEDLRALNRGVRALLTAVQSIADERADDMPAGEQAEGSAQE